MAEGHLSSTATSVRTPEPPPSPHADRLEFVDAFIDHARSAPGPDRLVLRPHIAVFVAAVAAACAVLVGLIVGLINSERRDKAAAKSGGAKSAASGVASGAYQAVVGWDCSSKTDRSFTAQGRTPRWITYSTGGWTGDDCKGSFVALPMSGDPNADDPRQSARWNFTPGTSVNRCSVAVFNPMVDQQQLVGASAARFTVLAGPDAALYDSFQVDQSTRPGSWVEAGVFPVKDGRLTVQLGNRGKPSRPQERLLVSQIRVTCGVVN
jgi:hypothetical protein